MTFAERTEMKTPDSQDFMDDSSWKKADLHCHSRYSVFKYFRRANTRDCYTPPEDVYRAAKARGMSYVTLTDHDSIDGALYLLDKYPDLDDFFISEEVETYFPETGQRVHIGAWNITEAQHDEIQRLRPDIRELVRWMKSEDILFGVNHLFQNYRMKSVATRYIDEMIEMFDIYEVMNGAMASIHNATVHELASKIRNRGRTIAMVGGSDAHTLKHVAKVFTVSKAGSLDEFLTNIRAGQCFAWGTEMRFRDLVNDIYTLILDYYWETGRDLSSGEYTNVDKTIQLVGRLAGIPTAMSGLPAAITSLNYLKQIVVSKGMSLRVERIVGQITIEESDED
ncbi:MAG: hypothetical protein KY459_14560 [Acidobacteria bacterium]|nr:hypothetical protein [Acidobacteriota bacterium]